MLIKYITALAWCWGTVSAALALLVQFIPPISREDTDAAARNLVFGIPAWAWLIARYLL